jgi:hypothetical protein
MRRQGDAENINLEGEAEDEEKKGIPLERVNDGAAAS